MSGGYPAAAAAFAETLERLDQGGTRDSPALGRRAAVLVVADALWREHLGPLLESRDVQELLEVSRQALSDSRARGRLLGLRGNDGQYRYPAFQFDGRRIRPEVAAVLREIGAADVSAHTIASWFRTPQRLLQGATPTAWMQRGADPLRLVEAARRSAARLSR